MVEAWEKNFLFYFKCMYFTHKEFNGFVNYIGMFCVEMSDKSRWLHSFISQNSSTSDHTEVVATVQCQGTV